MKNTVYYKFCIGILGISEQNNKITNIFIANQDNNKITNQIESQLLKEAIKQLNEYFNGIRKKFDLPLNLNGTQFQIDTWKALQTIPYGQACSYKQIAIQIGNPKAARAVGMANNRNPIMIIVPCHRVIGQNGNLVGYGAGLEIKKFLIELEKNNYDK